MLAQVIEKLNSNLESKPLVSTVVHQPSHLSHSSREMTEMTKSRRSKPVPASEPEPEVSSATAPPDRHKKVLDWMLDGAKSDDNPDWYIKRILAGDKALSTSKLVDLVPEDIRLPRSTLGKLLKPLKDNVYDSYIAEYCKAKNTPIENVYPYKVVVKESGGGLIVELEK